MKRQEYNIEDDALYRYTPIDAITVARELVITKDEFLMCYEKWIWSENEVENND